MSHLSYTHDDFWRAIDQLARDNGYSTSGLAKAAKLDATSFNKSKRIYNGQPRWPSTESIAKVLTATDTSLTEFAKIVEDCKTERTKPSASPEPQ